MTSTSVADATTADGAALPLSAALRAGTRAAHEVAEHSSFVEDLMAGRLDVAGYAALAVQQHAVYRALEAVGDALRDAGRDGGLVREELRRVPAIESDLAALLGDDWRSRLVVLPATTAYADRIAAVGGDLPRYAAHAYTRYLGDLSGGQVIKQVLSRKYGLTTGTSFYDFPVKVKPLKDAFRAALDSLDLTPAQHEAALDEARVAFRLNTAMFADLAAARVH